MKRPRLGVTACWRDDEVEAGLAGTPSGVLETSESIPVVSLTLNHRLLRSDAFGIKCVMCTQRVRMANTSSSRHHSTFTRDFIFSKVFSPMPLIFFKSSIV